MTTNIKMGGNIGMKHELSLPDDMKPVLPPVPSDDLLAVFKEVRECDYKGEHYSVRDNGAVMRHARPEKRVRQLDNVWSFGKRDEKTAYMYLGTHRVHIIVACAFHGGNDSTKLVVDHIDTNRCNNRPENLRWCTRLENALNNPVTRKRIEWLCGGDIQKFIDDPTCLRDNAKTKDISWMRTVTPQEAKNAYENVMRWAQTAPSAPPARASNPLAKDPDWIYKKHSHYYKPSEPPKDVVVTKRAAGPATALQRNWSTPTAFMLCPSEIGQDPIGEYASLLLPGAVCMENNWGTSTVIEAFLSDDHKTIGLASKMGGGIKPYGACKITFEKGKFVHEAIQSCFSEEGALKYATLAAGIKWAGGDVFDDFC